MISSSSALPNPLSDAAMHLTVGDHRVDDASGVLGHEEFFDLHMARLNVDIDDRHMACIGERAGRVVMASFREARLDVAFEAMGLGIRLARRALRSRSLYRCRRPSPCLPQAQCPRLPPQGGGWPF
jgi:hypothetical protein